MTGQLSFDLRDRAKAGTGGRPRPGASRPAQTVAKKIRLAVHQRPREPDKWHVRELISSIRRMWRKPGTPDAPPVPEMKPHGIRRRAQLMAQYGRQREAQ